MKTTILKFVMGICVVTCMGAGLSANAASFNDLQSHRAVYTVSLQEAADRSGIVGAKGRIVFQIEGNACDGMSINYRFVTQLRTGRDTFITDQQTASHESADGNELSFNTKSFVNEQQDQEIAGFATRTGTAVDVKLTGSDPREVVLENAVFPSTQLVKILNGAESGEQFLSFDLFDGVGDADELFRTSIIIGKEKLIEEKFAGESKEALAFFDGRKAWPITLSYFKKGIGNTAETTPFYEASYFLYNDGALRNLTMRYEDYTLKADLTEFEAINVAPCT